MSKFNSTASSKMNLTFSKDGVSAFKKSKYQELCDVVLTSFFGEDKFYESGKESSNRTIKLIREVAQEDPIFVAKLAVLAREKFNLRSITQVLVAELSQVCKGNSVVGDVVAQVVKRPDDMTEIMSYLINKSQLKRNLDGSTVHVNKAIPNQIKKGLAHAFTKFDEYQLDKYNSKKKEVKLLDVMRLVHPKPLDQEQAELWGRLKTDTLKTAETWEKKQSVAGQGNKTKAEVEQAKKENWEELILSKKLPYMAGLRNIRNIIQSNISSEAHNSLQNYLSNENAVLSSKQFPFRFWSAYKAITTAGLDPFEVKKYTKAIGKALYYSGKNVPKLKGRTLIACDMSGSMSWTKMSKDSTTNCAEVASVMTVLANQFCEESVTVGFATDMAIINLTDNPNQVISDVETLQKQNLGGGTNVGQIFDYLMLNNIKVDNIIIFTDAQFNGNYGYGYYNRNANTDVSAYRKKLNSEAMLYEINIAGYDSTQIDPNNKRNVFMSGFSDATLKYITEYQDLKAGIVDMVNGVVLNTK